SARFRSRSTPCAFSWSPQKSGCEIFCSSAFSCSRKCGASKIAPHKCDALFQAFIAVLQVFKDHDFFRTMSAAFRPRNELNSRITETATHIQANQSPHRV